MPRTQKTQYAILGALSVRPMSGYDIKKWVHDITGPFWSESSGQVYPTLAKLLDKNLIQCNEKTVGGRSKKIYAITEIGQQLLEKWLIEPADQKAERNEFRLKFFYGSHMPKKKCIAHIERQQRLMKENLDFYERIEKRIFDEAKDNENATYWLLTLKCAKQHAHTELSWCADVLTLFKTTE